VCVGNSQRCCFENLTHLIEAKEKDRGRACCCPGCCGDWSNCPAEKVFDDRVFVGLDLLRWWRANACSEERSLLTHGLLRARVRERERKTEREIDRKIERERECVCVCVFVSGEAICC
jgi:hypothetical protein